MVVVSKDSRENIMPDLDLLKQRKEQQLYKDIRVGDSYKSEDLKRKGMGGTLYHEQTVEGDIAVINEILGSKELNLDKNERAKLEAINGRNLSTLLLLQEKTFGDSKEMVEVKKSISLIEKALNRPLKHAITVNNIDKLLGFYDAAIIACRDYLIDKDPTYAPGKKRLAQVRLNMLRLHEEAESFRVARELLKTGVLNGEVKIPMPF